MAWGRIVLVVALTLGFGAGLAAAQKYKPEDPVPPDAKRRVLSISGEIRTLVGAGSAVVGAGSALAGTGSAVVGRVDPVAAALKDLGAKTTDQEIRIEMAADMLFDFDKADIKKEAEPSLDKVAAVLSTHGQSAVRIEGHTDGKGSPAYNQRLSERRANSVREWFVNKKGLKNLRITTQGFGAAKPVAPNTKPDGSDDPAGRQKNRRVEIVIAKQ